jgi:trans-aconitate methyltransferase
MASRIVLPDKPATGMFVPRELSSVIRIVERLLEQPWVYRTWQAPFADQKFAPILTHNDLRRVRRVLDIGCGPGTNAKHFTHAEYLGIDINQHYIEDARQRYRREFVASDVRTYSPPRDAHFDFILVNSFLHHLNSGDVHSILAHIRTMLTEDGHIHILELVMPDNRSIPRLLARWDRGKFARSRQEWNTTFSKVFESVLFEPYRLTGAGATLWNMVYFKGRVLK